MSINPYETLGLDSDATDKEIKRAYYMKAKEHHPDVGGDPKKFAIIKLSYDTLKDKDQRKYFDDNGCIKDDPTNTDYDTAIAALKQLFITTVTGFDPDDMIYTDIIGMMKKQVTNDIKKLDDNIVNIRLSEKNIRKLIKATEKKLKRDGNKSNFLLSLLFESINAIPLQLSQVEMRRKTGEDMLKILSEFSYDFETKDNTSPVWIEMLNLR